MLFTFEFIIVGLLTGIITGLTGASGVLIVVPILTTLFVMPLPIVLGTSLMVDVLASLSVSFNYARNRHIDIKKAVWILIGSLIGAQVGSFFVVSVSKLLINSVLSLAMIFFGVSMWRSGVIHRPAKAIALPENLVVYFQKYLSLIVIGFLIGLATGIFGAGGGLAIFIVLYSLLRLPIKTAVGTSIFVMFLTALSGVMGYIRYGRFDLTAGLIIGLAAALGGAVSSWFGNRIRDDILARLIGAFFILLALLLIVFKIIIPKILFVFIFS